MGVSIIHQTDLFHPPCDPDDHWDLACVYALAASGEFDLKGVVIDHPRRRWPSGDPALGSVAQLGRISGIVAPIAVGSVQPYVPTDGEYGRSDLAASDLVLRALEDAAEPMMITIVGSCRDIALAAARAPQLFKDKCRGIYLNAGAGVRDSAELEHAEWNTTLDPLAYAAMFSLPCPLYWMPCIGPPLDGAGLDEYVYEHATLWAFRQDEILAHLAPRLQAYFCYAFLCEPNREWLRSLDDGYFDADALERIGHQQRAMWCTAGFLHGAGYGVDSNGALVPADDPASIFRFIPITARCEENGRTTWEPHDESSSQKIFQIVDLASYGRAMTAAMRALLCRLQ